MARYEDILNYKSTAELENGLLKNNCGLENNEELEKVERVITNYKLAKLYLNQTEMKFTVDYYLNIHKILFEDIYPFAGQIRDEVIEKNIPFCLPNFIYFNLKDTLEKARKLVIRINNEEKLVDVLTYLYSELDIIHPFREGNGRVEREFLRQYVNYVSQYISFGKYSLDYSNISANEKDGLIQALTIAGATCELDPLKEYLRKMIVRTDIEKENSVRKNRNYLNIYKKTRDK